ncbi:hypothetical protein XENORESO_014051 [Xenotaenia resolanae]|uniref:Uncharacterized protein n=1 Tax=Xenotaenia resolanae TaxID=208358 RepID=A0ABV0VS64_9TELE
MLLLVLEEKFKKYTPFYAQFLSEAYKAFPMFYHVVPGRKLSFMVDSFVVKVDEFLTPPNLNGNYVFSVPASGHSTKEHVTKPIACLHLRGFPSNIVFCCQSCVP